MENTASKGVKLTARLSMFMLDRNQSERTFAPQSVDNLDDIAKFNTTALMMESEGRIRIIRQPDAWRIIKTEKSQMEHPATPSLQKSEDNAAAVAKTPWRVSLDSMKRRVANVEYMYPTSIPHMTIAVVLLDNGYALQGMSAPADPSNFDEQKGKDFAFENALQKLWALEAYVMRDVMSGQLSMPDEVAERRWAP